MNEELQTLAELVQETAKKCGISYFSICVIDDYITMSGYDSKDIKVIDGTKLSSSQKFDFNK